MRSMIGAITFRPELAAQFGLTGGTLRDLRDVVLLTGPNGGGKTRYLQLLIQEWAVHRTLLLRQQALRVFTDLQAAGRAGTLRQADVENSGHDLFHAFFTYLNHSGLLRTDAPQDPADALPSAASVIAGIDALTANITLQPDRAYQAVDRGVLPRTAMLRYYRSPYRNFYHSLDGEDLCTDKERGKKESGQDISRRRVRMFRTREELPRRLSRLARIVYLAEHPEFRASHAREVDDARTLWDLIARFLGAPLELSGYDLNRDEPRLAFLQRPFTLDELSEGQQVLLTWALTIDESAGALKDAIVLLDEPELHLHPSAAITAIEDLRARGAAQIWVATHSPAVIAHFGIDGLHYVNNGRIEYAGNKVERVLNGLLGEEGREDLRTFLADADELALYNFAAQCLVAPDSVELQPGDPQANQFHSALCGLNSKQQIHVLDYAAGKGRLARALLERGRPKGLLYHAYNDPLFITGSDRTACQHNVDALHQGDGRFYHERWETLTLATAPRMDAVILCNVLHEIPETEWLATLHRIADVLTDDGELLLMEDQRMTRGELPHGGGFIVLDDVALAELFELPLDQVVNLNPALGERLTCFRIPRTAIQRANHGTLRRALKKLEESTRIRLRQLRDREAHDHRHGREHAYLAVLLSNVLLALERHPT